MILSLGGAGAAFLYVTRPQAVPATPIDESWPVATTTAQRAPATPTISLYGRTESPVLARLSAAVAADVSAVEVEEGAWVKRGEVLVRLDPSDAEFALRQRRAEVSDLQAQRDMENERARTDRRSLAHEEMLFELTMNSVQRAQDLANRNLGSQSQLDASRVDEMRQKIALESRRSSLRNHRARLEQLTARLEKAEALRDRAALDAERTRITAPFDGRVTEVRVAPGNRVRVGDVVVSLFDQERLEVRAQIPTRYLPQVRRSLEEKLPLVGSLRLDGRTVGLRLHRLSGQVNPGQGGLDGLFRLDEAPHWLRIGRTVQLTLELGAEANTYTLPLSAIYGLDRIFTVVDGRLQGIQVERVGERREPDGRTSILVRSDALKPGQAVVTTQLPNAIDGLPVRPVASG